MNTKTTKTCCGPDCCSPASGPSPDTVRDAVREGYAQIARTGVWTKPTPQPAAKTGCCGGGGSGGGGCCGPASVSPEDLARAIGYGQAELNAVAEEANLGLSCGNPTALAALRPGEVVLDLGSGAGFDAFVAGPKVGDGGRVIGVDMTPEMLTRARALIPEYRRRTGLNNIEFRLGEIENLPVPDGSVDVVISNCVFNLSTDKPRVWREVARVLRPGGRVAISDLALLKPLPESVRADVEALVGCIAGAALVDDIRHDALAAGLTGVELVCRPTYVDAMVQSGDPLYQKIAANLPAGTRPGDFVTSLEIRATRG